MKSVITVASVAAAEKTLENVRVETSRIVVAETGRDHGVPSKSVTLSYEVSIEDLDITTPTGMAAAEKRIQNAATAACEEIGEKYPEATPDVPRCVMAAVRKPLNQLHAAAKHSTK